MSFKSRLKFSPAVSVIILFGIINLLGDVIYEGASSVKVSILIFGVIMGTHETIIRSAIADITPFYKRGNCYGVFNAAYGLALFGGVALMGLLYDRDQIGVILLFSVALEIIAAFLYFKMNQMIKQAKPDWMR